MNMKVFNYLNECLYNSKMPSMNRLRIMENEDETKKYD